MRLEIVLLVFSILMIGCIHTATIDEIIENARDHSNYLSDSGDIAEPPSTATVIELDMAVSPPCKILAPKKKTLKRQTGGNENEMECGDEEGSSNKRRKKRNAISDPLWPSGIIPYVFDQATNFSSTEEATVQSGIDQFTQYTCIDIRPRTPTDTHYVRIIKDEGCYSYIGRTDRALNGQELSLVPGCYWLPTVIHEFMHALGILHEQTRIDRDSYVTIHFENIINGTQSNFEKTTDDLTWGTSYDYRSVMHYGKRAFSIDWWNLNTISTVDPAFADIIGRAPKFSFKDLLLINTMYNCGENCPTSAACPPNSYRGKDCNCYCDNTANSLDAPAAICDDVITTTTPTTTTPTTTTPTTTTPTTTTPTTTTPTTTTPTTTTPTTTTPTTTTPTTTTPTTTTPTTTTPTTTTPTTTTPTTTTPGEGCSAVGVPCDCSTTEGNPCSGLTGTVCNPSTDACECTRGREWNLANKSCQRNRCRRLGRPCRCENFENVCSLISTNAVCEGSRCICAEGFYIARGGRRCVPLPPPCTTLGDRSCACGRQPTRCSQIPNSVCTSQGCRCACGYTPSGNTCVVNSNTLLSDGETLSPYIGLSSSTYNVQFQPTVSTDPTLNGGAPFGVPLNGRVLQAGGSSSGTAALLTPELRGRKWQVSLMFKLVNAEIRIHVVKQGRTPLFVAGYRQTSLVGAYFPLVRSFTVPRSYRNFKLQITVNEYSDSNAWSASIDPLKISDC